MIPIQTVHLVGLFFLHPHIFPENDPWGPATLPGCQVQVLWRSDATNPVEDHLVHVPCNEVIQVGMVGDPKMEALEVLYMTNITIFQAIFCGDIPWNLGLTWALYMGVTSNLATWNGHSASPISFAWTPKMGWENHYLHSILNPSLKQIPAQYLYHGHSVGCQLARACAPRLAFNVIFCLNYLAMSQDVDGVEKCLDNHQKNEDSTNKHLDLLQDL